MNQQTQTFINERCSDNGSCGHYCDECARIPAVMSLHHYDPKQGRRVYSPVFHPEVCGWCSQPFTKEATMNQTRGNLTEGEMLRDIYFQERAQEQDDSTTDESPCPACGSPNGRCHCEICPKCDTLFHAIDESLCPSCGTDVAMHPPACDVCAMAPAPTCDLCEGRGSIWTDNERHDGQPSTPPCWKCGGTGLNDPTYDPYAKGVAALKTALAGAAILALTLLPSPAGAQQFPYHTGAAVIINGSDCRVTHAWEDSSAVAHCRDHKVYTFDPDGSPTNAPMTWNRVQHTSKGHYGR